jgi:murein DD-endopeptidase MepM/ murein hydrolase activator NlpD
LQDDADKLGGCWKVGPNIKVGVQLLASHIKASGTHAGLALYNGHGSDAEDYADAVLALERKWRGWLAGLSPAATPTRGTTKPHAPGGAGTVRVFKLTTEPMSGSDIKSFQGVLNHRLERWGLDLRIEEDGVYGPSTRTAFKRVARGLGLVTPGYAGGATPELRVLIRRPQRRTPRQIARARAARPWLTALRKHYAIGGETSAGGSAGASGHYPLSRRGKLIGTPFSGTHTIGNWQSDNAVDLGVPVGTKMLALDDGKVIKLSPHSQDGSRFAGDAITIQGDRGNAYFYKHGVASVTAGQRVRRGQVIGTSGSASGSPHLHLGIRKGDPRDIIGQRH